MFDIIINNMGYYEFINKSTNVYQKEDPELEEILTKISNDSHDIKYTTYRCSTKLLNLKTTLFTTNIQYETVTSVLDRHQLNDTINDKLLLKPQQLTIIINEIFYASKKFGYFNDVSIDLELATRLLSGLIWKIFDPDHSHPITLLQFKQTMLILCKTFSFDQIIQEDFLMVSDYNHCVTKFRFKSLTKVIVKLLTFIDDKIQYGLEMLSDIVNECFQHCPGIVGLNSYQFTCIWKNPILKFNYLTNIISLVERINNSRNLIHHSVRCAACEITPIQGLRFKCQQCKNLSLCFRCFSNGFSGRKHDVLHKMYEITSNEVSPKKFITFLLKICNLFTTTSHIENSTNQKIETKVMDISDDRNSIVRQQENVTNVCDKRNNNSEVFVNTFLNGTETVQINSYPCFKDDLTTIVGILTEQNRIIENKLQNKTQIDDAHQKTYYGFLENHQIILTQALNILQNIWENSIKLPHSSTPYRQKSQNKRKITAAHSSTLSNSVHGAELNKSYLEKNKSDLSVSDVSSWFLTKKVAATSNCGENKQESLPIVTEGIAIDTNMSNFKKLIQRVKEIVDDSYTDNEELSRVTYHLEKVLDKIIGDEESKRSS